jgi:N-acetylglucosaminyldiphosphoundecaprenol N-acetyl-beta-D-mannosaminyltransferase
MPALFQKISSHENFSQSMALAQDSGMASHQGWQQRWRLMVSKMHLVQTLAAEEELLQLICSPGKPVVVAFANAHAFNSAASSPSFFQALHLNGTDLIPKIIRLFNGRRVAFFGTQEPYLQQGLSTAGRFAPQSELIGAHGFLETEAYLSFAATQRSDLIVLGMGMPKQEAVAAALRSKLDFPCTIVCGGAIIDFLAGRTARAPAWMRRAGVEWVYRLAMEPKRLFHRYVIGNPVFLMRALWLKFSGQK